MKATLKYLLKTQSVILMILMLCVLTSPWRHASLSVLMGGLLCLLTTVAALLIFAILTGFAVTYSAYFWAILKH